MHKTQKIVLKKCSKKAKKMFLKNVIKKQKNCFKKMYVRKFGIFGQKFMIDRK